MIEKLKRLRCMVESHDVRIFRILYYVYAVCVEQIDFVVFQSVLNDDFTSVEDADAVVGESVVVDFRPVLEQSDYAELSNPGSGALVADVEQP